MDLGKKPQPSSRCKGKHATRSFRVGILHILLHSQKRYLGPEKQRIKGFRTSQIRAVQLHMLYIFTEKLTSNRLALPIIFAFLPNAPLCLSPARTYARPPTCAHAPSPHLLLYKLPKWLHKTTPNKQTNPPQKKQSDTKNSIQTNQLKPSVFHRAAACG